MRAAQSNRPGGPLSNQEVVVVPDVEERVGGQ